MADRYGPLPEGFEWLSVIFRDQKVDQEMAKKELGSLIDASGSIILKSAYLRAGFSKSYTAQTGKEIILICQKDWV